MKSQAFNGIYCAAAMLFAATFPLNALAEPSDTESTGFILNLYLYGDNKMRGLASTVFLDDQFSYDYANRQAMTEFGHHFYCPPGNILLTPDQMASVLTHFLESHPDARRAPLHETIYQVLRNSFPCK